ncbi:MAG: hypothetical protein OHK0046_14550 [Anaerolineae bacterium]
MTHDELVALIRPGITTTGGTWADFGAGTGHFTRALRDVLGAEAVIHAVDRDAAALRQQEKDILTHTADFTKPLNLPLLEGALMANALHFILNQQAALAQVLSYLRPGGVLILVEYAVNAPRSFIPHPVPYTRFVTLAEKLDLVDIRQLHTRTSPRTGLAMYSAAACTPVVHSPQE